MLPRAFTRDRNVAGNAPTRVAEVASPAALRGPAATPVESEPSIAAAAPPPPAPATSDGDESTATVPAVSKRTQVSAPPKRARTREVREPKADSSAAVSTEADGPTIRELLDEAASAFVLGQMPRARSIYQQVLDRQPTQADAWRGLGLTASRMGQRKDAERAFERYLRLRPNAPDAARLQEQLDKMR